jgi:translation initiation factor 3 subunit L
MVHIAESTVGRRYAGWFIKNTERAQKIFDDLKNMPLPTPPASIATHGPGPSGGANPGLAASAIAASIAAPVGVPKEVIDAQAQAQAQAQKAASAQRKVAWGGTRA